jgi:transposase
MRNQHFAKFSKINPLSLLCQHAMGYLHYLPTLSRCKARKNLLPSAECFDKGLARIQGGAAMAWVHVERLDHLGLIAGMSKDLDLIRMIDARLIPDEQEEITPGEAVAGRSRNGLGFANRPVSLTPQFFANKPLDLLLRPGGRAERFNRLKLGRTLDAVHPSGCALLFSEVALAVCAQERLEQRFHHLDTTSFSLSGAYVPESDEHAMRITHGDAKDHRPDVKPAVLALLVSQEGGVPLVRKTWDGNTSDTQIFQERAEALLAGFARSPTPRYLVADATLSTEDTAATLAKLGFLTRLPGTRKLVSQVLTQALRGEPWQRLDETTRDDRLALGHYGMPQRWRVVSSQAAMERAEASLTKAQQRAWDAIDKHLCHLQAQRFATPEAAQAALQALATAWRSQQLDTSRVIEHKRDAGKGRPTPTSSMKALEWQRHAQVRPAQAVIEAHKQQRACFGIGTNIAAGHVSDVEVIRADKAQASVEGGCRLLKDPLFFVSSLCITKPSRIQGLLMVMTLALLVYARTQRRLRQPLAAHNATIPHQIHQPTARPTLRWVFQLLEGIHRVRVMVPGQVHDVIEGLNNVQIKILRLFGNEVCRLYQISPG